MELDGPLVAGVGARPGTCAEEVLGLLADALADAGRGGERLALLATVDSRAAEPGLVAAAAALGVPLAAYPAAVLAAITVPHPSAVVTAAVGTPSVAEAAALAGAPGGRLVVPKRTSARATVAVAVRPATVRPATVRPDTVPPEPVRPDTWSPDVTAEPDLRHHGDAEVRAADLVDLAVNVRAGTPPAWLREVLAATLADLAAYPDQSAARAAVAARHGRPVEEVLLTSGAAEAFVLLARTLRPRHPVVVHPQFTEPEAALRDAGHEVHRAVLRAPDGFRLLPGAVPEEADLVVLGNPTNPTSVLHPAEAVAALARPGRTLVVDEAFMDTVPGEGESLAGRRDLPGTVVVLRSLTKTWGLAGLRIGYVLGPADLVAALGAAQPLWPVSAPALTAAEACSTPAALAEARAAALAGAEHRAHLLAGLARVPGVRVHGEPRSSFVLVELADAAGVRERLRAAGFAVRRGDTFPGLGPDWLRIAVRDPATSDRFLAALAAEVSRG